MISVIVPVYKVEKYLDRCVESILSQTYRDFELLLVDDGSPDRCGVMCDTWATKDSRIRVFHKPNGGLSDARNYALDRMRGDYVSFVDSDDWLDPECLEYQLGVLLSVPDAKVAVFGCKTVRDGGANEWKVCGDTVMTHEEAMMGVLYERGMLVTAWGKLYRREIFSTLRYKVGVLMEDEDLIGEVLSRTDKVVSGSSNHYYYLQRNESIVHQSFTRKKYDDQMSATEHLISIARKLGPKMEPAIRRREARDRMSLLRLMGGCAKEFIPLRKELRHEVLSRWPMLFDPRAQMRDKLGLMALVPGFWCFELLWNFYGRIRRN